MVEQVDSSEYHEALAAAMDEAAKIQQEYNKQHGTSCCLQFWMAPINNARAGSDNLPEGVHQLIHFVINKCDDVGQETQETQCFCIKETLGEDKIPSIGFFLTQHSKGSCPHRGCASKKGEIK